MDEYNTQTRLPGLKKLWR